MTDPGLGEILGNVGDLFLELLKSYATYGLPFLVLHVVVLILSIVAWREIHGEIRHLDSWPSGEASSRSPSVTILNRFARESEELGRQGFLVPASELADQLESVAGGKATALYEKINLFLLVGIAGTLFGVFEFADTAQLNLGTPDGMGEIAKSLSASLAKAFPVGFVGLVLMFLGQVGASFTENRLKRAVARATEKALEPRVGTVRSQAQVFENAAERMERALEPLENLQETMAEYLTPVVRELGERLEQSLGLVKQQFAELESTTSSFATAVTDLGGSVAILGTNTGRLDTMLTQAPAILVRLAMMQSDQQKSIAAFQDNLNKHLEAGDQTVRTLGDIARATQELPGQILQETQAALKVASESVTTSSREMVTELKQRIAEDYDLLFKRVDEQIKALRETLLAASGELKESLKSGADSLFAGARNATTALETLIQSSEAHLQASLDASQGTIAALDGMREAAAKLPQQILDATQNGAEGAARAVAAASATMAEELKAQVADSYDRLFEKSEEQITAFRNSLTATSKDLLDHLESSSGELLTGVKGQVESVRELVRTTSEQLQEINRTAQEAVAGLRSLHDEAKSSMDASFKEMGTSAAERWQEMSRGFAGQAQNEFSTYLNAIQTATAAISAALDKSARSLNETVINAETLIKEPITEVLKSVERELQKGIQNLDNLLAQRYPEVVKDVGEFTRGLQGLLEKSEAVQKTLDRWAEAVGRSQQEMEAARKDFLDQLAVAAPLATASAEEVAARVQEKVGQQLAPVQSKLSQLDEQLNDLTARSILLPWKRRPAAAPRVPRPEPVPRTAVPGRSGPSGAAEPPAGKPSLLGRINRFISQRWS